jgi:hypothetical protein
MRLRHLLSPREKRRAASKILEYWRLFTGLLFPGDMPGETLGKHHSSLVPVTATLNCACAHAIGAP